MTMKFDLAGFAAHCLTMEADIKLAEEAAMERACQMVEKAAKRAIGKYLPGYNWPELAAATQEERVRLGFDANKPLLRTGELRDSISHVVGYEGKELVGYVGSTSKIALYQEMGTSQDPAAAISVRIPDGARAGDRRIVWPHGLCGDDARRPELPGAARDHRHPPRTRARDKKGG